MGLWLASTTVEASGHARGRTEDSGARVSPGVQRHLLHSRTAKAAEGSPAGWAGGAMAAVNEAVVDLVRQHMHQVRAPSHHDKVREAPRRRARMQAGKPMTSPTSDNLQSLSYSCWCGAPACFLPPGRAP